MTEEMSWLDSITDSIDMSLSKLWKIVKPGVLQSTWSQRVGHDLSDLTTTTSVL